MATTTATPSILPSKTLAERAHLLRNRAFGVAFIVIALAMFWLFGQGVDPKLESTYGMNQGNVPEAQRVPDWVIPSFTTVTLLAVVSAGIGAYQLVRGFGRATSIMLGLVALFFVFAFLTWATRDQSINLAGMLKTMVDRAVPLTLGAMSGILCERAGVVNIAIEGLMLSAAMVASVVASVSQNLWLGLAAAILTGAVLAFVHAILSIRYKVDQIISGTVINIFATGITSYMAAKFLDVYQQQLNTPDSFPSIPIPLLSNIPFLGGIFFNSTIFTYGTYILLVVVHVGLFYTRWGLRVRSVGEHPRAADTLGINVYRVRYVNVVLGGLVAGFAGAFFSLGSVGRFERLMTAGRGFIALAAMIFGKWTPFGAAGSALIFGLAESLQGKLSLLKVPIPSQFLLMAPYIATMIALAGLIGRAIPPAADGQPYEKD